MLRKDSGSRSAAEVRRARRSRSGVLPRALWAAFTQGRPVLPGNTEGSRCPQQPRPSVTPIHTLFQPPPVQGLPPNEAGLQGLAVTRSRCCSAESWVPWQVIKTESSQILPNLTGGMKSEEESLGDKTIFTHWHSRGVLVGPPGKSQTHTPLGGFPRPRHNTGSFPWSPPPSLWPGTGWFMPSLYF